MKKVAVIFRIAVFMIVFAGAVSIYYSITLPDKYYIESGENVELKTFLPISATKKEPAVLAVNKSLNRNTGNYTEKVDLKLFDIIPIKKAEIETIERPMLIPCGTPFGIKILTEGAVVTGFGNVGETSPAENAGIRVGDVIVSVNGQIIEKNSDILDAVQENPNLTIIEFIRDEKTYISELRPRKTPDSELYKIGVWVRDSSAGIGTMTYYDPEQCVFGGLGHGVCDVDTGKMLPLSKGEAVSVTITNVIKGQAGYPGELCGTFLSRVPIGRIIANTSCGVFGTMSYAPTLGEPIPLAYKQEVNIGKATILSTIDGVETKEYDILIEKIDYNTKSKVKNMIVRVTDPELLAETGGIVQGMSGSPIIQNGKLVGAVTHVFVNDATRGYAIFAENMYRNSGKQISMLQSSGYISN